MIQKGHSASDWSSRQEGVRLRCQAGKAAWSQAEVDAEAAPCSLLALRVRRVLVRVPRREPTTRKSKVTKGTAPRRVTGFGAPRMISRVRGAVAAFEKLGFSRLISPSMALRFAAASDEAICALKRPKTITLGHGFARSRR